MSDSGTVTIDTILHAPVKNVWTAWTDPAHVIWFGSDPNGKVLDAKMDVRTGGKFEISFKDSNGTEHTCSGRYIEVIEPSRLAFTWNWKSEPGIESFISILLETENSFTKMHFEHTNLGYPSTHNYQAGWETTFVKLDKLLSGQTL